MGFSANASKAWRKQLIALAERSSRSVRGHRRPIEALDEPQCYLVRTILAVLSSDTPLDHVPGSGH